MMGSFITRAIIMALGYVYPAYECYKIVERKSPDLEHLRFWCQYWMIIAVVTVLERLGDVLISWVPMYSEAKLAFIIYLWYPKTMGTTYIYHSLLRPFVAKHESEIDQNLNELRTRAGDVALLWWQRGSVYVQARFFELLQFLASQSDRAQHVSVSTQGAPSRPPRNRPQGGGPLYPPQPPARAAGAGVHPGPNSNPNPKPNPKPLGDQAAGAHLRRQSGSRGLLQEGEGEPDQGFETSQPGLRPEGRVEQSLLNSRIRADNPWNLSDWLPAWVATTTAPSKKVD